MLLAKHTHTHEYYDYYCTRPNGRLYHLYYAVPPAAFLSIFPHLALPSSSLALQENEESDRPKVDDEGRGESMGNILKCLWRGEGDNHVLQAGSAWDEPPPPPAPSRPHHDVASLIQDLLYFGSTSMVPEALGQHVTSSKKAQVQWYRNILEAYKNMNPPPKTGAEAANLIAAALSMIQRSDLEGVLSFYNLPIPFPLTPSASASSLPDGVQFVVNTLPVHNKCIGDGDGFSAYVDTADPRESANVPLEVHEMVFARSEARTHREYQKADALLRSLHEAGYKIITISGKEILAKKYRIRMRGVDAPELKMANGEESKNALVKLIGGKRVTIYVYGQDQFGRYVGDIYCGDVFIQEQMLKSGQVWHFKAYDQRPNLHNGRERQELHAEGFLHQRTLRGHGIGEETSAMQTFRSTNGAVANDLIAT